MKRLDASKKKIQSLIKQGIAKIKKLSIRDWLRLLGVGLALVLLSMSILVLLVKWGVYGPIPTSVQLDQIENPQASIVYSEDQSILGKYFIENRTDASYADISPYVIEALVATEDARFFKHQGIDWRAWGRVLLRTVLMRDRSGGGGSTLSQQLAKNLYPRKSFRTWSIPKNKLREVWTARALEKHFTKEEILTLYLNTVSFGGTTFGIQAASRQLFNATPKNLNIEQAALLVGMLKATTFYHPTQSPDRARLRRNTVLSQMAKYGYIDTSRVDSLQQLPLQIDWVEESHNKGIAPYFREHLRLFSQSLLQSIDEEYNIYTDGFRIYTTIDRDMQMAAEESVATHMKSLQEVFENHWKGRRRPWEKSRSFEEAVKSHPTYQKGKGLGMDQSGLDSLFRQKERRRIFQWSESGQDSVSLLDSIRHVYQILHTGFLAADPSSGAITAWVGGINHEFFQYDHVLSKRQIGSTIKPVIYAEALRKGYQPCDYLENELISYPDYKDWTPENSDGEYGGLYSLQGALSHSVNTIAVWLALELGMESIKDLAQAMGISSNMHQEPSLALGTVEASLWDMVQLYTTLANQGTYTPLHFLTRIESSAGDTIWMAPPLSQRPVLEPEIAATLMKMLKNTVERGTATRLRSRYGISGEIAGKTGTTQAHADGWFIGITPKWVAGVWVGAESPEVRFRTTTLGQGANTALPIWAEFYKRTLKNSTGKGWAHFVNSSPLDPETFDCEDYVEELPKFPFADRRDNKESYEEWKARRDEIRRNQRRAQRNRRRKQDSKLETFFKNIFKKKN